MRLSRSRSVRHAAARTTHAALGAGAVAVGVVGAIGASWAALAYEARAASSLIESAAQAAAGEAHHAAVTGRDRGRPRRRGHTDAPFDWEMLIPSGDGIYEPSGIGPVEGTTRPVLRMVMLGDSTAVGYGCSVPDEKPGVLLARGVARALGRPVQLATRGKVGSGAADLARQVAAVLSDRPRIVMIMVGANDVRDTISPRKSAAQLGAAVATLHDAGVLVVVATCPDLGVIKPIAQPLRRVAGMWSRVLAAKQERAVDKAGGVPVPLGTLVSPEFYGRPDLFYADGFHPNGLGYAKATAALLPVAIQVLRMAAHTGRRPAADAPHQPDSPSASDSAASVDSSTASGTPASRPSRSNTAT